MQLMCMCKMLSGFTDIICFKMSAYYYSFLHLYDRYKGNICIGCFIYNISAFYDRHYLSIFHPCQPFCWLTFFNCFLAFNRSRGISEFFPFIRRRKTAYRLSVDTKLSAQELEH